LNIEKFEYKKYITLPKGSERAVVNIRIAMLIMPKYKGIRCLHINNELKIKTSKISELIFQMYL
jgi:hypothetical protein